MNSGLVSIANSLNGWFQVYFAEGSSTSGYVGQIHLPDKQHSNDVQHSSMDSIRTVSMDGWEVQVVISLWLYVIIDEFTFSIKIDGHKFPHHFHMLWHQVYDIHTWCSWRWHDYTIWFIGWMNSLLRIICYFPRNYLQHYTFFLLIYCTVLLWRP